MENDEDLDGREQAELVPRLNVLWYAALCCLSLRILREYRPLSFSED